MAMEETQDVLDETKKCALPGMEERQYLEISTRIGEEFKRIIQDERRNFKPVELPTDAAQP